MPTRCLLRRHSAHLRLATKANPSQANQQPTTVQWISISSQLWRLDSCRRCLYSRTVTTRTAGSMNMDSSWKNVRLSSFERHPARQTMNRKSGQSPSSSVWTITVSTFGALSLALASFFLSSTFLVLLLLLHHLKTRDKTCHEDRAAIATFLRECQIQKRGGHVEWKLCFLDNNLVDFSPDKTSTMDGDVMMMSLDRRSNSKASITLIGRAAGSVSLC